MTTQNRTYGPPVTGDGSTAGQIAKTRWLRHRWIVGLVAVIILAGLALILPAPTTSQQPFALDNPSKNGGRALAQVLSQQGVNVEGAVNPAQAASKAGPDSTLLVWGDYYQHSPQTITALSETAAGIVVLINPRDDLVAAFTPNISRGTAGSAIGTPQAALEANCTVPAALAAEKVNMDYAGRYQATATAEACFSNPGSTNGAMATDEHRGRTIYVVADSLAFDNTFITEAGHAALALHLLGSTDHLVWYLAVEDHQLANSQQGDATMWDLLPSSAQLLTLLGLLVVVAAAVWRGRRFGPLITEDLPVEIRATETTEGLASLYRRSAASARALAALRGGAAARIAARIGVPRTAQPSELIAATARATGRTEAEVTALLYDPVPAETLDIVRLAQELQHLENEVHKS